MAAETLSGLVHNEFFSPMEELQVCQEYVY